MRSCIHWKCLVLASFVVAAATARAEEKYTYPDLVRRLTDLERLAVLPVPGETCQQWSSYDRKSRYDEATGKYVDWAANQDGNGIIRQEGEQIVMAEMEGPGCIWRVWSARTGKGHVKIYLDGAAQPAVDLPFADYFTGKQAPFNFPALSYRLEDQGSRGMNLYVPMPYQKSCKIVADPGWGAYYHFTYSTFPKGTQVPTFRAELAKEDVAALAKADAFFREKLGTDPAGPRTGEETATKSVAVAPGKTVAVAQLSGARAIAAIKVKMDFKDREDELAALRKLVLQIRFDGQPKAAVCCPLGDFFGTAPGVNLYKSLATGMTKDGFYSFWYMPFARSAVVELINEDQAERAARFEIVHAPLVRPFEGLGYFHAKWHRDVFPVTPDRFPDWTLLKTSGRGRFCGVMLHLWSPRGGWWGEGDEKFFVDGEKFPSTFGTGSEDYFGYAWGDPHLFQTPFHCQTMTENNKGHQSLLRWHIVDNVPFQTSFEGCIEKYFGNRPMTLYAATACWYLAPGGDDPFDLVPAAERHGYWVHPAGMPARGKPQAGTAGFKVLGRPTGRVSAQEMGGFDGGQWDNGDQLFWTGGKPGDKLELALPVAQDGKHKLSVVLTKARDYGTVQLHLDGEKLGAPIDLYNAAIVPTGPIALGTAELTQGEHKLTVEIVGANPKTMKDRYFVGIDRVVVEPVR